MSFTICKCLDKLDGLDVQRIQGMFDVFGLKHDENGGDL